MVTTLKELLSDAKHRNYAVGAFNVYNLEGVKAVINAAEAENSPVILQLHPAAFQFGGAMLAAACLRAAEDASVNVVAHLDHSASEVDISNALKMGLKSVMADGSSMGQEANYAFTAKMADLAHQHGAMVEAEIGRLSGTEDGLTVEEFEAKLTDPATAVDFVRKTKVDCLAVCIGNVHGHYKTEPSLDFARLEILNQKVSVPLVLHGVSGLSKELIERAIDLGIVKFNVNTELRDAYIMNIQKLGKADKKPELMDVMRTNIEAMQAVVTQKMRQFRSSGKMGK